MARYWQKIKPRSPWTPNQIRQDLLGWWDPSDVNTLIVSGSSITQISDKAMNGCHLVAPSGREPALTTNSLNGFNTMDLSGNKKLVGNIYGHTFSTITVVCVAQLTTSAVNFARLISLTKDNLFDYDSTSRIAAILRNGTSSSVYSYRNVGSAQTVTGTYNTWRIFALQINSNSTGTLTVDNLTANINDISSGAFDINKICVGDNNAENVPYWNSPVGEILIAKTAFTPNTERMMGYIAHKYALTANLASNHPYKNIRP